MRRELIRGSWEEGGAKKKVGRGSWEEGGGKGELGVDEKDGLLERKIS